MTTTSLLALTYLGVGASSVLGGALLGIPRLARRILDSPAWANRSEANLLAHHAVDILHRANTDAHRAVPADVAS